VPLLPPAEQLLAEVASLTIKTQPAQADAAGSDEKFNWAGFQVVRDEKSTAPVGPQLAFWPWPKQAIDNP
jgi:hypothetical protein